MARPLTLRVPLYPCNGVEIHVLLVTAHLGKPGVITAGLMGHSAQMQT